MVSVRIELNLFDPPSALTHKDFMELALLDLPAYYVCCALTVEYSTIISKPSKPSQENEREGEKKKK
jgi:hypothetical protein